MILAIVGPDGRKFNAETEQAARVTIREVLISHAPDAVVSGACPYGGIDIWAIEEAKALGIPTHEFPPLVNEWVKGYRPRNIKIAIAADEVVCVTVRNLPNKVDRPICKHCGTAHLGSGGCWTVSYARNLGKKVAVLAIG